MSQLENLPLVSAISENRYNFAEILQHWFRFMGGRPGEVVIVDGGSSAMQKLYWRLFQTQQIDQLQVIHPTHEESTEAKNYVQDCTAGLLATKPYLLFFKVNTLPFRRGCDDWLDQAIGYLDRDEVFAIGGAFQPDKHHDAWPGWYYTQSCSLQFALMKRQSFLNAMYAFSHAYGGDRLQNLAVIEAYPEQFHAEITLAKYMQKHRVYMLCKLEDSRWFLSQDK